MSKRFIIILLVAIISTVILAASISSIFLFKNYPLIGSFTTHTIISNNLVPGPWINITTRVIENNDYLWCVIQPNHGIDRLNCTRTTSNYTIQSETFLNPSDGMILQFAALSPNTSIPDWFDYFTIEISSSKDSTTKTTAYVQYGEQARLLLSTRTRLPSRIVEYTMTPYITKLTPDINQMAVIHIYGVGNTVVYEEQYNWFLTSIQQAVPVILISDLFVVGSITILVWIVTAIINKRRNKYNQIT